MLYIIHSQFCLGYLDVMSVCLFSKYNNFLNLSYRLSFWMKVALEILPPPLHLRCLRACKQSAWANWLFISKSEISRNHSLIQVLTDSQPVLLGLLYFGNCKDGHIGLSAAMPPSYVSTFPGEKMWWDEGCQMLSRFIYNLSLVIRNLECQDWCFFSYPVASQYKLPSVFQQNSQIGSGNLLIFQHI